MPNSQKKSFALSVTVAICIVLVTIAVLFSQNSPGETFDFIPDTIGPAEIHYLDMEYSRPNAEEIIKASDELIEMIKSEKSFTEQSKLFTELNDSIVEYRTMLTLAQIRYYTDMSDEFYKEENDLLQTEYVSIYDKTGELLDIIAKSTFKNNYERTFFGVGYFDNWTDTAMSDTEKSILKREQELISQYQDLMASPFVEDNNGTVIYLPSDEFYSLDYNTQKELVEKYRQKYNELLGGIYVELVKIRLELAGEKETDYISIAYRDLGRDYTPEEANAYIDSITAYLLPKIDEYEAPAYLYDIPTDTVTSFYHLSLAAKNMGGRVEEAFDYMVKYGLYEVSASETKQNLSFETFIEKYYSPFMFVSATETAGDLLSYAHEFGHFADDYINISMSSSVDSAEIASQSMEYIVPIYSGGMGSISAEEFLRIQLYNTLDSYYSSVFVHKFETAVYSLEPEEVTLEKLNEIAKYAALELGFNTEGANAYSLSWFEYQHIYLYPMYYSAYTISNDAALQVLEAELDNPLEGGIEAYLRVIDRDPSKTFVENIEAAELESPFAKDRAKKLAELMDRVFLGEESAEEQAAA